VAVERVPSDAHADRPRVIDLLCNFRLVQGPIEPVCVNSGTLHREFKFCGLIARISWRTARVPWKDRLSKLALLHTVAVALVENSHAQTHGGPTPEFLLLSNEWKLNSNVWSLPWRGETSGAQANRQMW
jgi:hypothetical protein